MEVATPAMLRALRYVRTLNEQRVYPTFGQLVSFADAVLPKVVLEDAYESELRREVMSDHHYEVINSVGPYLLQVEWVAISDRGVELTQLGKVMDAYAGEADTVTTGSSLINVVLKGNDPLSYVDFIEAIQRVGGGADVLLIDPYLPATHTSTLVDNAGVSRILTTDVGVRDAKESRENRTQSFGLMLGARAERGIQARYSQKGALHDRLILPTKGTGLMVGRSLGGRQMTAVVELNETLTQFFREHYEPIWKEAEAIEPIDLSHVAGAQGD